MLEVPPIEIFLSNNSVSSFRGDFQMGEDNYNLVPS